jgi:hypothetical protein
MPRTPRPSRISALRLRFATVAALSSFARSRERSASTPPARTRSSPAPTGAASPTIWPTWKTSSSRSSSSFPDRCAPFKEHHVVELARGPLAGASRHHRRDAKRALARCEVELVADPPSLLDEWTDLYAELVRRHAIVGETAFSRASFERQLRVPGLAAFRASAGGALLGAALWFLDRGVAYYHLAAYTEGGYANGAGYALVAAALEHFAEQGAEWASLGAGLSEGADDGLTRFKAGWTDETRTAFLCGRILAPERYAELLRGTGSSRAYFPGYRNRQR